MYNLIEYFEENDKVTWHLVDYAKSKNEIDKKKVEIAKELNDIGIETLEVLATKNINSMKEILKRDDIKIFQVVKENFIFKSK